MTDNHLRAVALIRMSTGKASQASSPARQRDLFAAYCARFNLTPAGEYEDLAVSATRVPMERREGLMRMWQDAGQGRFDVVWCEELSRAARDVLEALQLDRYLQSLGIALVDGNEDPHYKVSRSQRRWVTTIKALRSQDEAEQLSERVKRAQRRIVELGGYEGGPLPAGLAWDATAKRYVVDETMAPYARRCFELFAQTKRLHTTARMLVQEGFRGSRGSPPTQKNVKAILTQPAYRGQRLWGGRLWDADLPEVVPRDLVAKVDTILAEQEARPQRVTHEGGPFTGLLKCHVCGHWLRTHYDRHNRPRHLCAMSRLPAPTCTNRKVRSSRKIERAILPIIAAELREIADRIPAPTPVTPSVSKKALATIEAARKRAIQLYVDGAIARDEFDRESRRLDEQQKALPKVGEVVRPRVNREQIVEAAMTIERRWATMSNDRKRELLQAMIDHVVLNPDRLSASEVVWRL